MKNLELLETIEQCFEKKRDERFFLSYNSLTEEAIRLALLCKDSKQPLIVVKENNYLAAQLRRHLQTYFDEDEIVTYLPEESLRAEEIASSFENRAERLFALYRILTQKNIRIILTSPYGYIRHLPSKEELLNSIMKVHTGDILSRDELIENLRKLGYEKVSHVETPMTYASRGYIVDLYSVNYDQPIRIEFFDNEIDSIRFFDVSSQRTIEVVKAVDICFARDVFFSDEEKDYLKKNIEVLSGEMEVSLEYLYEDIYAQSQYFYYAFFKKSHLKDYVESHILCLSNKEKIDEHLKMLTNETVAYIQEMHEEKKLPLRFYVYGDMTRLLSGEVIISSDPFKEMSPIEENELPYGKIDYLMEIVSADKARYKLIILSDKECEDTINALITLNIPYNLYQGELKEGISIAVGYAYGGFVVNELKLSVYTSKELFKERNRTGRFAHRYAEASTLNSYEELDIGDYVVHDQYGIGQYAGIETRKINGVNCDYLRIIYKGNDELLVPLSQFSLVRKYVSKEGAVPKLHKLGSKEWQKTKERVEESVDDVAARLIDLYSAREENIGFAYSKDSEMQKEFEDTFAYELTADQAVAIEEVKGDMEKAKPMDRLLCGDVGFGKTEVAIRAAFKAVNDSKQVAYLCPTTILSLQHYKTFISRFRDFPCRVELLNRYVSEADQKRILKDLSDGLVDIVIGTHRILSRDVKFRDLGLLIIDEEQRFGVEHKEKIKELKTSIDVLSLSATPIPRTLQMSLIGLRGLSTLNTPPQNRYPVQTYIVHKSDALVEEVIMRELERNGQVFYLFNNVERIYGVAKKLSDSLPYARIGVAHGKMDREEIEDVMLKFHNNEINVLICTTIIETGIDIPNANTIIIDNAQNFGLSQLYQIKGRVGRSDRIAYAYLLIPEKKELSEDSLKRLNAIKEFASLGSGYRIAMRDLTIRGAGDLLGDKQSGFIDNVGLDLYLAMLSKAIKKRRGEEVEEEERKPVASIPIESYIPENFSENDYEKLNLYHELYAINDKEELLKYYLRISDEYGKLPKEVEALFEKKKLELLINLNCLEKIALRGNLFTVVLTQEYSDRIDGAKLFAACNEISRDIRITYKFNRLELSIENQKDSLNKVLKLVDRLDKVEKDK